MESWWAIAVTIMAAVAAAFALWVAIRSYRGERSDFERWPSTQIALHPEFTGVTGLEQVSFRGTGGELLAAWYAPARNRAAIVLAHGTNAERSSLLAETRLLAAAGFGVLALDFPGQGASGGVTRWGAPERGALVSAVDWLAGRAEIDPACIGGFGLSLGGYILAQVASTEARLSAVVLSATPTDIVVETRLANSRWGLLTELPAVWALKRSGMPYAELRPLDVVAAIAPRPVLIIGGELDSFVPAWMTQQLFDAARAPKWLWIVPLGRHGGYVEVAPRDYCDKLVDFFSRTLLEEATQPSECTPLDEQLRG